MKHPNIELYIFSFCWRMLCLHVRLCYMNLRDVVSVQHNIRLLKDYYHLNFFIFDQMMTSATVRWAFGPWHSVDMWVRAVVKVGLQSCNFTRSSAELFFCAWIYHCFTFLQEFLFVTTSSCQVRKASFFRIALREHVCTQCNHALHFTTTELVSSCLGHR